MEALSTETDHAATCLHCFKLLRVWVRSRAVRDQHTKACPKECLKECEAPGTRGFLLIEAGP